MCESLWLTKQCYLLCLILHTYNLYASPHPHPSLSVCLYRSLALSLYESIGFSNLWVFLLELDSEEQDVRGKIRNSIHWGRDWVPRADTTDIFQPWSDQAASSFPVWLAGVCMPGVQGGQRTMSGACLHLRSFIRQGHLLLVHYLPDKLAHKLLGTQGLQMLSLWLCIWFLCVCWEFEPTSSYYGASTFTYWIIFPTILFFSNRSLSHLPVELSYRQ